MAFIGRVRSEIAYLKGAIRTLSRLKPVVKNTDRTWPDVLEQLAEHYGDRPALLSAKQQLSYRGFNERANQYARWAHSQGIGKGDVVALFMMNSPEYMAAWTGLARAGAVTALLNTNLKGHPLAHCINIVAPKALICENRLLEAIASSESHMDKGHLQSGLWVWGASTTSGNRTQQDLSTALDALSTAPLAPSERPAMHTNEKCLYIYTSGTTGLPKAANINHYRSQAIMNGFSAATKASAQDRMYSCMPMYHSAGGLIATGSVLTVGGSIYLAEKFSASQFWDDVVDNNCTMFQYIGELCRYLVNSPQHPKERSHNIRLCNGNGLRPDIWDEFRDRFQLPQILEWYAATEGNAVFFNFDGKPGSIGRIPKWAEHKFLTKVVKFDYDEEQPLRDAQGHCIECEPNEIGEVISEIRNNPKQPSQRFEGYSDPEDSAKKILHDVFSKGDKWFRTGDLMRKDALGYFYFIDRTGDTFRWKGENVATSEVSEAITVFDGVNEANVYGVSVPGKDGRAGMAALVADDHFDAQSFYTHVVENLPEYARPVFLRLQNAIDITGTFKQRKVELVKEGFSPTAIRDTLLIIDHRAGTYVPLTTALHEAICSGEHRL